MLIPQDGDGFIGQEDYRLAKHLDNSRKGYLSINTQREGQRIMADNFFKKHDHDIKKFPGYSGRSREENIDYLMNGKWVSTYMYVLNIYIYWANSAWVSIKFTKYTYMHICT